MQGIQIIGANGRLRSIQVEKLFKYWTKLLVYEYVITSLDILNDIPSMLSNLYIHTIIILM